MRLTGSVAALSVVVLAGACSKPEEPVVTKADAHASALAPAPQAYQRMRFVSPVEQSRTSAHALASTARHSAHATAPTPRVKTASAPAPAADPLAALASSAPAPVVTASNAAPEAGIVVALKTAPEPAGEPAMWASEPMFESHRAVIRGGAVGPDKCDPLSDMRARRAAAGSMRAPSQGGSVFARGARR